MSGMSGTAATIRIADSEGKEVEATEHGEIKTSIVSIIMYDQIEGSGINTNVWTTSTSTMTANVSGGFLNINANASTTANAYAVLTSNKVVPFYGEQEVELSCSVMLTALPGANEVIEIGFGLAATNATPTDGAILRITGGLAYVVINFGGVETIVQHTAVPAVGVVQDYDVLVDSSNVEVEIDGVKVNVAVPAANPFPTSIARQPVFFRVYNKATPPATGVVMSIGRMEVTQAIVTANKPWPEILCEMARSSYQLPSTTYATTCNWANSAAPASATLSNTTGGYATLDGQFKFAAPAAAETDYALFAFQVPSGYQMKVTDITINTVVEGVAVVTPTTLQWGCAMNSTAQSLATADGAGTVAPRRKPIGLQTFAALAGLGTAGTDLSRHYDPPLICDSNRWFHIILKVPDGAATASLVFRGVVSVGGFFE